MKTTLKIFGLILMIAAVLHVIIHYEDEISSKMITHYLLSVFVYLYGHGCLFQTSNH